MRLPPSTYLHMMFKSPNPSANLKRRDEADATDQIFLDTPAINGGEKSAHLFVGKKSKLTDAFKSKDLWFLALSYVIFCLLIPILLTVPKVHYKLQRF
jgi:hypothetical protein